MDWFQFYIQKKLFSFWGKAYSKGSDIPSEESKNKAKAARNENQTPICGNCEKRVEEGTETCPKCECDLYTYRGRIARIGFAVYGFALLMSPFIYGILPSLVAVPVGILLIYLWVQCRRDMPLRELHLREKVPFV
ncbi:MAG: hypothetical protein ABEH61_03855 [Haloarculaceae archaeon]